MNGLFARMAENDQLSLLIGVKGKLMGPKWLYEALRERAT